MSPVASIALSQSITQDGPGLIAVTGLGFNGMSHLLWDGDDLSTSTCALPRQGGSSRGQSESVGVILLTAVIVILVGGFGVIFLGADGGGSDGPLIDTEVNATSENVSITHAGGKSAPLENLDILLRTDAGDTERYTYDPANVTNDDGDDQFEPGERFRRSHDLGSGQLEVRVIHTDSNTLVEVAHLDT